MPWLHIVVRIYQMKERPQIYVPVIALSMRDVSDICSSQCFVSEKAFIYVS